MSLHSINIKLQLIQQKKQNNLHPSFYIISMMHNAAGRTLYMASMAKKSALFTRLSLTEAF